MQSEAFSVPSLLKFWVAKPSPHREVLHHINRLLPLTAWNSHLKVIPYFNGTLRRHFSKVLYLKFIWNTHSSTQPISTPQRNPCGSLQDYPVCGCFCIPEFEKNVAHRRKGESFGLPLLYRVAIWREYNHIQKNCKILLSMLIGWTMDD